MDTSTIERKSFDATLTASDDGTFTGYASVFDTPDSYGDVMVKGAFARSLAERGLPILSYEHDWSLGPIGLVTSALEDDTGLKVTGELFTDDPLVSRIYRSMKAGQLKRMSFAFITRDSEEAEVDSKTVRRVTDVDLLEAAVVVEGAHPDAEVVQVRSSLREAAEKALDEMIEEKAEDDDAEDEDDAASSVTTVSTTIPPVTTSSSANATVFVAEKAGARNSSADLGHVQSLHDTAVALGAACAPVEAAGEALDAASVLEAKRLLARVEADLYIARLDHEHTTNPTSEGDGS